MAFNAFGQLIAQYNSSLPTLTDGDFAVVSVDVNGRVIVTAVDLDIRNLAASQDNVAIQTAGGNALAIAADGSIAVTDNGSSLTVDGTVAVSGIAGTVAVTQSTSPWVISGAVTNAVLTSLDHQDGAAWAADNHGIEMLAVRHDATGPLTGVADGDYSPLQVDANGNLKVAGTFAVQVDDVFESGTEGDAGSDSAGDGIVPILKVSMSDVVTIPVGAGVTYYVTGLDFSADNLAAYELIIDDDGTPTEWIRVGSINGNVDIGKSFERAIEITGAADRSLILRAQALKSDCNASGGINGYTR